LSGRHVLEREYVCSPKPYPAALAGTELRLLAEAPAAIVFAVARQTPGSDRRNGCCRNGMRGSNCRHQRVLPRAPPCYRPASPASRLFFHRRHQTQQVKASAGSRSVSFRGIVLVHIERYTKSSVLKERERIGGILGGVAPRGEVPAGMSRERGRQKVENMCSRQRRNMRSGIGEGTQVRGMPQGEESSGQYLRDSEHS